MSYESKITSLDENTFVLYAISIGKNENEARVDWRNIRNKNKYVICESREGYDNGRMFIRTLTNSFTDYYNKLGWWNTFTISTKVVDYGMWLCSIQNYRLDKKGYINMIVSPIIKVPTLKVHQLFNTFNGTWNSPAIQLMLSGSNKFLSEYNFPVYRTPNVDEIYKRFPQYANLSYYDMCVNMLHDWLNNKITLEAIEEAINTLNPFESLIKSLSISIAHRTVEQDYSNYPLLAKKLTNIDNFTGLFDSIDPAKVQDYIERNVYSYLDLVRDGKIQEINSDEPLDKVETVLAYRKAIKDAEKKAKKEKRN